VTVRDVAVALLVLAAFVYGQVDNRDRATEPHENATAPMR
jgi:hypothetical protein